MAVGFRQDGPLRALGRARLQPVSDLSLARGPRRTRLSAAISMPSGPGLVRPSALAQPWEAALIRLVRSGAPAPELHAATAAAPEGARLAAVIELARDALDRPDDERALRLTGWLVRSRYDPGKDPFLSRYGISLSVRLPLSAGLDVTVPLETESLRLLFAELAAAEDPAGAAAAVEALAPSTLAASSLTALYSARRRWSDIAQLTSRIVNVDAASAAALIRRGVALRELGLIESALDAFDKVVRPNVTTARPFELRAEALLERASTHLSDGRRAPARRDLERVLQQFPESTEARELLDAARR
ncbi:tetratricopeptide repeat protein [Rathayibacter sp. Leaf248]|uniref:tetratricopeptide repeat protein n=1 Tax=Rathayibacter sp. Leaf248 TaxID=2876555 RepID=UPI001E5DFDF2|nr:tetratricopeptide repeat protein [Rathayibacter sp. Leaf248]